MKLLLITQSSVPIRYNATLANVTRLKEDAQKGPYLQTDVVDFLKKELSAGICRWIGFL